MTTKTWTSAANGDFADTTQWTGGSPASTDDAVLAADQGTSYTASSSVSATVNSIQTAANATLSITGGTFTTTNGTGAGANAGSIVVGNNSAFRLGGAVNNSGSISVNSGGNYTDLVFASNTTLSGGGTLTIGDLYTNRVYGTSAATVLTNVNNTISGGSDLGGGLLTLVNQAGGTINATATSYQLRLNTGVGGTTNAGLIEATGSAGLLVQSTKVNNSTGGVLLANTGSHIDLQSANIIGGTLKTLGTGVIQTVSGNTMIDGSGTHKLVAPGNIIVGNNTSVTLQGSLTLSQKIGTVTTNGTLSVNSAGNYTDLIIGNLGASISSGQVVLSDIYTNRIYGTYTGGKKPKVSTLTNSTIIRGAGTIGADLILKNSGTINATGGNALNIATGHAGLAGSNVITNSGTLETTSGGGGLHITGSIIANSSKGLIKADGAGTHVDLQSVTITGGTLQTLNGGLIQTVDAGVVLDASAAAINNKAHISVNNNTALKLKGALNNTGSISINSAGNYTDLIIGANTTLTGGGTIAMSDIYTNRVYGATAATVLTNTNNTLSGGGQLGYGQLSLINQAGGTINANANTALTISTGGSTLSNAGLLENTGIGALIIDTAGTTVSNTGLIKGTGAGGVALHNTTINDSTGTMIQIDTGSHLDLDNTTITGGTIKVTGTGYIQTVGGNSILDGSASTFNKQGLLNINNNTSLTMKGAINNIGSIAINSAGNYTDLIIGTNTTLTGGGNIVMGDIYTNRIYGATTATTLTNVNNTISGGGSLGYGQLTLINQAGGTINATTNTALTISTGGPTLSNAGLIEASGAGGLYVQGTTIDNVTTGVIKANTGSQVDLIGANIIGGTVQATGTGYIQISSGNTTLDGSTSVITKQGQFNVNNNTSLTLKGSISNTDSISINSAGNFTDLIIGNNTTLTGGGSIVMSDIYTNRIYGATAATVLTNANNTISGAGSFGYGQLTLVNQAGGTINATGTSALTINAGSTITNAGLLEATNTGSLNIANAVANSGSIVANGGNVVVSGALTGAGAETIIGASVIEDVAASSNTVTFAAGSTGTLKLDAAQSFTGSVAGFNSTNAIDLANINNSTATTSFSAGVLTITDGTTTASIALTGTYTGASFAHSDDGSGHAKITVSGPGLVAQQTAFFAQSVAAFGIDRGTLSEHGNIFAGNSAHQPVLATAHRLAA